MLLCFCSSSLMYNQKDHSQMGNNDEISTEVGLTQGTAYKSSHGDFLQ